ncbi:MAG: Pregnancy-associated plasma protein-A [Ferruginibacter sp.]|uniref:zinc metalloprotease n=1 Tax=Ferruginibacter sp. TaxID=1940288 RepID=UPI0026586EAC|nr:zinc metalloprotease [Ferruginibacter sp.]MDB5280420.1 Pregnancy-associated plasma protein-A [Ferruginibacter sp.]
MKKISFYLLSGVMFFASCTKVDNQKPAAINGEAVAIASPLQGRTCGSMEVLQANLAADPGLRKRMDDIENFTSRIMASPDAARLLADGTIEIPVVVNVLYSSAAENISDAQINSQITVLNADFKAMNSDYGNTPTLFQSVLSGNVGVSFVLDKIIRKATTKASWRTDDAMKKSKRGGIDPTNPTTELNLWSCNLSGGILGYAQFPGGSTATDGVVIDNNAFGNTGTVTAPYDKGRTATHEVGHWMNLRHIWGDANCGSDLVNDTPTHNAANFGCPAYPHYSTCTGTPVEMTMNYMDYTDDACMYMFSAGQKTRMQAVFATGGPRAGFRVL